jgi:hypothetical protein
MTLNKTGLTINITCGKYFYEARVSLGTEVLKIGETVTKEVVLRATRANILDLEPLKFTACCDSGPVHLPYDEVEMQSGKDHPI